MATPGPLALGARGATGISRRWGFLIQVNPWVRRPARYKVDRRFAGGCVPGA